MVRGTGIESVTHAALGLDPVIHIAALLVSISPYTDVASRVAVAKLRLDGTPTPRSWTRQAAYARKMEPHPEETADFSAFSKMRRIQLDRESVIGKELLGSPSSTNPLPATAGYGW